jgi:hypothetical protein
MQPGQQTVPALAFSFFNPDTRRYETQRTMPLKVEVSPVAAGSLSTTAASAVSAILASDASRSGLRPDHVETGEPVATLRPLYFQPWFVGTQSALILCFASGLIFLGRREQRAEDADGARLREATGAITACRNEMDAASSAEDATRFFQSARAALQQQLATRWHVAPASITIAEIDERLNGDRGDLRRVFAVADQAAYSGQHLTMADFQQWKTIVNEQLKHLDEL